MPSNTVDREQLDNAPFIEPLHESTLIVDRATYEALEESFAFQSELDRKLVYSVITPLSNVVKIWRDLLAVAVEIPRGQMIGQYSQAGLLDRLRTYLPNIVVHPYNRSSFRCARVSNVLQSLPSGIYEMLLSDLQAAPNERPSPVFVSSGRPAQGRAMTAIRRERMRRIVYSEMHFVKRAQRLLNGMRPQTFQFNPNACTVTRGRCLEGNELTMLRNLRILADIQQFPQPLYTSSVSSPRINAIGYSLQNAPRWMRRSLGPDWIELDLSSASLAIVQKLDNLPVTKKYLSGATSAWKTLHSELFPSCEFGSFKGALKKLIIPCLMGGRLHNALRSMKTYYFSKTGEELPSSVLVLVEHHPLVEELVHNTLRLRRQFNNQPYVEIAGGISSSTQRKTAEYRVNNLLSQRIFKHEWDLLNVVILAAKQELMLERQPDSYRAKFKIMIWQHDGFSIKVRRREDRRSVVNQLKTAVSQAALQRGYLTTLEMDYPEYLD